MAHGNEISTLELHIKVNGQNLSAVSEKCNIGTLRVPSDPSWPKIPPRRSSNDTDDIIEPPCVVTLTGTPRKDRSMMQTVACQHLKSRSSQKYKATTHITKRLPGCFDPRFRRQITQQKAEKPDELCNRKNDKQTPELDSHISQRIEKLEDKSRKIDERVDDYTYPPCHDVDNLLSSVGKSTKKTTDYPTNEQSILEAKHYPSNDCLQHANNERYDFGSGLSQEEKQESNRPLLLMVDNKKIHALPINNGTNTKPVEPTCSSAQSALQCYSVQIPVVAYREIPLQISSIPTQMEKDVKMTSVCENDGRRETAGNICTRLTNSMCSLKEFRNEKYLLNNVERCRAENGDDIYISENKSTSKYCDGYTGSGEICDRENIDSNVSFNRDVTKEITPDKTRYGNSNALDNADKANNDGSYSNSNTAARLKNFVGQSCATYSSIVDGCTHSRVNTQKRKLAYYVRGDRGNADNNPPRNVINDKMLGKSMQSLISSQVYAKEYSGSNKEKESKREREQRINVKRNRVAPMNLLRKAKSFFRKKSRLAITGSDCTLIRPGYRCVKGKRYEKMHGRSKVSLWLHEKHGINSTNSILVKYNASKQSRLNSRLLTNLRTRNSFEKPSSIPLETRELLNKSYWEYYWKLKCKTASAKSYNATGERDKSSNEDHLPESQTLRQCSVLSCMINTALRDSALAAAKRKPTLDPVANATSNARESVYQASRLSSVFAKKIKREKMKRGSKRLLSLRAIALLCIAIYVVIIFLPIMYDYFFVEEYDENANYIELTFRYIASSFGEALDGVIDVLTTILLRPVRFDRRQ